jgi:hypothetical protein
MAKPEWQMKTQMVPNHVFTIIVLQLQLSLLNCSSQKHLFRAKKTKAKRFGQG